MKQWTYCALILAAAILISACTKKNEDPNPSNNGTDTTKVIYPETYTVTAHFGEFIIFEYLNELDELAVEGEDNLGRTVRIELSQSNGAYAHGNIHATDTVIASENSVSINGPGGYTYTFNHPNTRLQFVFDIFNMEALPDAKKVIISFADDCKLIVNAKDSTQTARFRNDRKYFNEMMGAMIYKINNTNPHDSNANSSIFGNIKVKTNDHTLSKGF